MVYSMIVVNSSHVLLKLVAIVLAMLEIKLLFYISHDNLINESCDSVSEILSP